MLAVLPPRLEFLCQTSRPSRFPACSHATSSMEVTFFFRGFKGSCSFNLSIRNSLTSNRFSPFSSTTYFAPSFKSSASEIVRLFFQRRDLLRRVLLRLFEFWFHILGITLINDSTPPSVPPPPDPFSQIALFLLYKTAPSPADHPITSPRNVSYD